MNKFFAVPSSCGAELEFFTSEGKNLKDVPGVMGVELVHARKTEVIHIKVIHLVQFIPTVEIMNEIIEQHKDPGE